MMARQTTEQFTFTVDRLKKLEARERRYYVRDTKQPKLALVVTPNGAKSFFLIARGPGGRSGRVGWKRIGSFPTTKIDTARRKASSDLNKLAAGTDVFEEYRRARAAMTLGELWDQYLKIYAKKQKRSWRNDELQFEKHFASWRTRPLSRITSADVSRHVGRVERDRGGYAKNRALALLSSMWGWAERERGLDLANPCRGVKRAPEAPRERYLLPDELRRFHSALLSEIDGTARDALLLLLYTGQRKATITALRWSEVDLRDSVLKIPANRMKAAREHVVPLAKPAREILEARDTSRRTDSKYVFPTHSKAGHLSDLRASLTRALEAAEIDGRFTPHDLRRTWATYCREKGRDPAPVLGHVPEGVTEKHYAMATLSALRETARVTVDHILATAATEAATVVEFPGADG